VQGASERRSIESVFPAEQLHRLVGAVEVSVEPEEPIVVERPQRGIDAERQTIEYVVEGLGASGDRERSGARGFDGEELDDGGGRGLHGGSRSFDASAGRA
jgi:hypothetical protein